MRRRSDGLPTTPPPSEEAPPALDSLLGRALLKNGFSDGMQAAIMITFASIL